MLTAACGSTTTRPLIGLSEPTAVAVFTGITPKDAELHPYLAVANGGRDDLTLVDAVDGEPVLAPVLVRALAVPTVSRPYHLVGAPLADGQADLLAVVGAGSSEVQVVDTWSGNVQVQFTVDVGTLASGAEVLSAVAASVPALDGGEWKATAGRVRLVLGLTGGRLAVLEFRREGAGIALDDAWVQAVGFDAIALAARAWPTTERPAEATDVRYVWAATRDDVPAGSGAYGVVELDSSAPPEAWPLSLLPAGGPTRLIATAHLAERARDDTNIPLSTVAVDRVYAALDRSGCGGQSAIACGIVIIDPSPPVRGILPDPLGELPYHPPIQLPAEVVVMATAVVPVVPPKDASPGRMQLLPGTGTRDATGVLAAAAANGRVYTVDIGRRTTLNNTTLIRPVDGGAQTRTRVDSFLQLQLPNSTQVILAVWCDDSVLGGPCEPTLDPVKSFRAVKVTPGYTADDVIDVGYQAILPGLALRQAETGETAGEPWIAFQTRRDPGPGFTGAARLYDPELGVQAGDIVQIYPSEGTICGREATDVNPGFDDSLLVEAKVAGFALPDPDRHPGGALLLDGAELPAEQAACLASLVAAGETRIRGRVRAGGFVTLGRVLGYGGRPAIVSPPGDPDLRIQVDLRYADERAPEQACPLVPWPADPGAVTCLGECRERCERRVLARKSRRYYTVTDQCGLDTETCSPLWGEPIYDVDGKRTGYTDPLPAIVGPVLSVLLTVRTADGQGNLLPTADVDRGLFVEIGTAGGVNPMYRAATTGTAVSPTGIVAFDRSPWDAIASYRFYVSYASGLVLDFSPGEAINTPRSIR
jgi:hypothetical protein